MTLDDRVRYATAKVRNIVYYRLDVEENNAERYRCQYMHVLRQYRKLLVDLVNDLGPSDSRTGWFEGLIDIIDPKIKSNECLSTIEDLEWYINNEQ